MSLTAKRDPELLARLREESLASLIEMARWKSAGHAYAAFTILGRITGYSDEAAQALWDGGDREIVIQAASKATVTEPSNSQMEPTRPTVRANMSRAARGSFGT